MLRGQREQAGVYENNDWSFGAESSLGLQGNFTVDDKLSATLQVVARGGNSYRADVDWAYLSYELTPKLLLQAGHKRLPIYYYSDFMYVGYSYVGTATVRPVRLAGIRLQRRKPAVPRQLG